MKKNIEMPGFVIPGIEDITRRDFLVGGAAALLLGGCSGGGEENLSSSETRTVRHALGTTEVPVSPGRVILMDGEVTLDPAVAIGLQPVAAVRPSFTGGIPDQVEERIEGELADIGTLSEPNIERIAALEPDLILGSAPNVEAIYERLSEISSVVALEYEQSEWKEYLREVARVLNREDEPEQLLEDYQTRAESIGGSLGGRREELTFTIARATDLGFRYLTLGGSFPGTVFRDVGLRTPPEQEDGGAGEPFVEISQERTPVLEADYIFLTVDEGTEALEPLESNPLWGRLEGEKIQVPSSGWVFGNVLTANNILDDLERYVGSNGAA